MQMFLPNVNILHFLKCSYNPEDLPVELPLFYRQILYAWFLLKTPPANAIDVRRESICFNQFITIGGKYVYHTVLMENEIFFIQKLIPGLLEILYYQTKSND